MSGYVYLLSMWEDDTNLYKIGVTKNDIDKRIKSLQTGNPSEILLINSYKSENYRRVETMLHHYYSSSNKRGEWFTLEREKVKDFTNKCEYFDRCINLLKKENPFYK